MGKNVTPPAVFNASVAYFERDGKDNLPRVLSIVRRTMKRRPDLRTVVFLTAFGEGPARAYNLLQEFDPRIIAVTFPPTLFIRQDEKIIRPVISQRVLNFFAGVRIRVLTSRLPFDSIDGAEVHNREMELMIKCFQTIGGSFPFCIQAALQVCDMGAVEIGEKIIVATGDCAAVITATATKYLFSKELGLAVNEILCKSRNPTLVYTWAQRKERETLQKVLDLKPSEESGATASSQPNA